jgi:hypothetical protein
LGASGGIGQPLSLLLKTSEYVNNLSLYDIVHTPGVAADLSHINTGSKVCFILSVGILNVVLFVSSYLLLLSLLLLLFVLLLFD